MFKEIEWKDIPDLTEEELLRELELEEIIAEYEEELDHE
ncbi:hypothetical protein SAMN04490355_106613 [Pelosinus propionicus DSM 13327]|uniref:Uncharacterized protein n=1 Tax=Pelosinus propionicus DSM 13327 TaxID=1123291 RepID=A0A1I4PKR0_9FIRM|nr:hypothetical protein SAMN04490355_106613 [Pelosinus propionicus DSM 13327]